MKSIFNLAKSIFPFHRSITGQGVEKTLNHIKKNYLKKLQIKTIKSGEKVFDWKIPSEWVIRDAFLKNSKNEKIIDLKNNNLHVVQYSKKINKVLNRRELLKHLHFNKNFPNAIPYVTSYYKRTWGFCLTYNQMKKIKGDSFFASINSNFKKNGKLTYGELYIKGKTKKEILISTYVCHPSMGNNEVSGNTVSTFIAKHFEKKKLYYSLRFIFVPETIGSISYIKKNYKRLKENVIAAYNLTCVGDNKKYSFINTRFENTLTDRVAEQTFKEMKIKYKKYSFLDRGSDERQFNAPNIDIPMAVFTRSKFGTYKEYHTSKDDLNFISQKGLSSSYELVKKTVNNIQKKIIPLAKISCEPMMSKRKLYPTLSRTSFKTKNSNNVQNLMNFIAYCDGKNELEYISRKIRLSYKECLRIYKQLIKLKIIKKL